jgi:type I restriction enzyme M protein
LRKAPKPLCKALLAVFGVRNPEADIVVIDGEVQMDSDLTDYENVPLKQDINSYMAKEVLPHAPDAVIDEKHVDAKDDMIGIVGYEINFNRYFYVFEQPRHPNVILEEIKALSAEVAQLLGEI